jgi:hypothetical protein
VVRNLEIERCPHCSVSNPLLVEVWSQLTQGSANQVPVGWGAFACTRCGGVSVASGMAGSGIDPRYPNKVFPTPKSAHRDLPDVARTFLQQAFDTLHAPDAAAVMAGSAVDAMLKSRGLEKGSLYDRIDQALDQHILTDGMARWAHSVRLGSNRPRHSDADNPHVSEEEAQQSVEFAEALGQFLFVLTAKIERGIEAAKAAEIGSHG